MHLKKQQVCCPITGCFRIIAEMLNTQINISILPHPATSQLLELILTYFCKYLTSNTGTSQNCLICEGHLKQIKQKLPQLTFLIVKPDSLFTYYVFFQGQKVLFILILVSIKKVKQKCCITCFNESKRH